MLSALKSRSALRTLVRRLCKPRLHPNKKRPLRPGRILGRSRRRAPWYHPPFHHCWPQGRHWRAHGHCSHTLTLAPLYRWAAVAPTHPLGFSVAGSGV